MIQSEARERALAYLAAHRVMTLATHGAEGPWAAAVFYVNDGFDLHFVSAPATRHCRDLTTNAAVAASVQEDYGDWREIKGIQLEGRVAEVPAAELPRIRELYGRKFPMVADPPEAIAAALTRVRWYRLTATRAYFVDNSAGFGRRNQVL